MAEHYAIGLGGQKCASSWVHAVLAEHPAINAAPGKELDFFSYHHDRGHDWYARRWQGPGLRFENSPSYLHDPRAPLRLRAFAPDARLIVTLRDPVERAFSHHLHEIARGHIPAQPFAQAQPRNPDYLEQGRYAGHLRNWHAAFPAEQMLILLAEDIAMAPEAARVRILRFLDLAPGPAPAMLREARNVSDRARLPALRSALRASGGAMRAVGLSRSLAGLKRSAPAKAILQWNDRPLRNDVPPLTDAERAAMSRVFAADMAELAVMMGRTSLPWSSWQADRRPARMVGHR